MSFFKKCFTVTISLSLLVSPRTFSAEYDRLDGKGRSGMRVDCIEWEGNLELHFYPPGKVKELGMKIDDKGQRGSVMVINYRFKTDPETLLIRRAILGVSMAKDFKVYQDTSTSKEYDKIIVTNNEQQGTDIVAFNLTAPSEQLYPDEHPLSGKEEVAETATDKKGSETSAAPADGRAPSSVQSNLTPAQSNAIAGQFDVPTTSYAPLKKKNAGSATDMALPAKIPVDEDTGTIPFQWMKN